MSSRFFIAFLFAHCLFATVNEPLRITWFSGYRNDRIHWHLQDAGEGGAFLYSALGRDVEFWENGLNFKVIHRDLTFQLRGSYSAFGKGRLIENPPFPPSLRLSTEGWAADLSGYFGYAVNLTADRLYKVIFTPLIGYSGHFERLKPVSLHMVWNGFFFGGGFTVVPGGRIDLDVGYAYNLLHNHFHTHFGSQKLTTESGGNMGQSGWAQMNLVLSPAWRLGLGGQINYFSSRVVNAHITPPSVDQKFKLRWTNVAGWLQLTRQL